MRRLITIAALVAMVGSACSGTGDQDPLVVYSGRSEDLVGPLISRFSEESGIEVEVRYGDSPELATTILLEDPGTRPDVFLAQDPASLGVVANAGVFRPLPADVAALVPERFSDPRRLWVGISGRARTFVYNPELVASDELPSSVAELADPRFAGLGIAPTNGSFLAFVAAMILDEGEDATRSWLEAVAANSPADFTGNSPIVAAADAGEIRFGLVNHYYLLRLEAEQGSVTAANHFLTAGDAGSLVMPSGAGIVESTGRGEDAEAFIRFLLSSDAQTHFASETFEYPLIVGVAPDARLVPLDAIATPDIDLSDLADVLDRATELVTEAGLV